MINGVRSDVDRYVWIGGTALARQRMERGWDGRRVGIRETVIYKSRRKN